MKTTSKQKLVQTQVPVSVLAAIERRAKREGLSVAAMVRQILLRDTGITGLGEALDAMAEDVEYESNSDNGVFYAPHAMRIDSIVFDGDRPFTGIFVGASNLFHVQNGAACPSDFPKKQIRLRCNVQAGMSIMIQFRDAKGKPYYFRIIGKRFADDQLPSESALGLAALVFRGEEVSRGQTTEAIVFPQYTFRGEVLASSEAGWKIEAIEIARRKVCDGFMLQHRQEIDLPSASVAHEVRIIARNLGKKRSFEARLYGSTVG